MNKQNKTEEKQKPQHTKEQLEKKVRNWRFINWGSKIMIPLSIVLTLYGLHNGDIASKMKMPQSAINYQYAGTTLNYLFIKKNRIRNDFPYKTPEVKVLSKHLEESVVLFDNAIKSVKKNREEMKNNTKYIEYKKNLDDRLSKFRKGVTGGLVLLIGAASGIDISRKKKRVYKFKLNLRKLCDDLKNEK